MAVAVKKATCLSAQPVIHFITMIPLLVVTSDISFGDLIRQSLEGTGRFSVCVTGEKKTAVNYIKKADCPLTFLDTSLNEKKVLDYELGSDALKAAIAKSKFKSVDGFGCKLKGHLLLQDHGGGVWFRNLKLRLLPAK